MGPASERSTVSKNPGRSGAEDDPLGGGFNGPEFQRSLVSRQWLVVSCRLHQLAVFCFGNALYRQRRAINCGGRMNRGNIFAELRRRNVYKVAVAYAVAGWALAQGIAQVFPIFDVPNWIIRLIVVFIIIGFPFALIFA